MFRGGTTVFVPTETSSLYVKCLQGDPTTALSTAGSFRVVLVAPRLRAAWMIAFLPMEHPHVLLRIDHPVDVFLNVEKPLIFLSMVTGTHLDRSFSEWLSSWAFPHLEQSTPAKKKRWAFDVARCGRGPV